MGDITITVAMRIIAAIAITAIAAGIVALVSLKRDKRAAMTISGAITIALVLVAGGSGIWLYSLTNTALAHGLYTLDTKVSGLSENIANSPIDQSADFDVNAEHTNEIVVVYRFTCPDCEGTFHALKSRLDATQYDVYWISSRSDAGRALCDLYGVSEVPSIITFDANGRTSVAIAYESDSAGNPMLDQAAVDIAIRSMDESNGRVTSALPEMDDLSDLTATTGAVETDDPTDDEADEKLDENAKELVGGNADDAADGE